MSHRASRYRLAPHVHACCTGKHVVFLDLKRDRYSGIDATDVARLNPHVAGLPIPSNGEGLADRVSDNNPSLEVPDAQLIQELLSQAIIIETSDSSVARTSPFHVLATRSLIEGYADITVQIGLADVLKFLIAVVGTTRLFRKHSLEYVVGRVQRHGSAIAPRTFDIEFARERLAVFARLRPFLYSSHNACLLNSLTVRSYLSRYGVIPRLIFGVTTEPFKAHCWLQYQDIVINDTPEHVRDYTPILVV